MNIHDVRRPRRSNLEGDGWRSRCRPHQASSSSVCLQISQPGCETCTLNTVSTCFFGSSSACQDLEFPKKNPRPRDYWTNRTSSLNRLPYPADIQPNHLAQVQMGMPLCSATHFVYNQQPFQNISADRNAFLATLLWN